MIGVDPTRAVGLSHREELSAVQCVIKPIALVAIAEHSERDLMRYRDNPSNTLIDGGQAHETIT